MLYKHIIQVENRNVGLKVWGGGTNIPLPTPNQKSWGGAHAPSPPPPPPPVCVYIYIYIYIYMLRSYQNFVLHRKREKNVKGDL